MPADGSSRPYLNRSRRVPTPSNHTGRSFKSPSSQISFSDELKALLQGQKKSWKILADGYVSLASVRHRELSCRGFDVTLQYNPGRMTSTAAPVDEQSISDRSCFLCVENLPKEQEGLLYSEDFIFLCNPAPIFAQHFTISHLSHRPQALEPFLSQFFSLAKDLSPAFSVFYNGPRCGASAPDHMHFQASPAGLIPVEREMQSSRREAVVFVNRTEISTLKDFGRETIILEGTDPEQIGNTLLRLLGVFRDVAGTAEEPMVNIICTFRAPQWRVILFPRKKHRPDAFFRKDKSRILVSPAAVDMGGLIITPSEIDFNRLDGKMIETIYSEVSLDSGRALEALS